VSDQGSGTDFLPQTPARFPKNTVPLKSGRACLTATGFGRRIADVLSRRTDERRAVDYSRFHDTAGA
jgi:hypothetical protein